MLRQPKTMVAPVLGMPRQVGGIPKSLRGVASLNDGAKIEQRIEEHIDYFTRSSFCVTGEKVLD